MFFPTKYYSSELSLFVLLSVFVIANCEAGSNPEFFLDCFGVPPRDDGTMKLYKTERNNSVILRVPGK
jgi:hypothetical protein